MKRIFAALMSVCLMLSTIAASAEAVSAQVNAPDDLHLDFDTPQNVRVVVNAAVETPTTEVFPAWEVKRRIITETELTAMADAVFGPNNYQAIDSYSQVISPQPFPVTTYQNCTGEFHFSGNQSTMMMSRVGDSKKSLNASYSLKDGSLASANAQCLFYQYEGENYTNGNLPPLETIPSCIGTLSLYDATQEAQRIAASVNHQLALAVTEAYPTVHYTDMESSSNKYETVGAVYVFHFTHQVGDAIVTYDDSTDGGALDSQNDTYTVPFQYEQFWLALNESGIMGMEYISPYEITGVLENNVTLLPFDSILSVAQAMLPLKYAASASNGKVTLTISRVVLGYTRVAIKDSPERFQLVPVWDFMGTVTFSDGYSQGSENTSLLCIDASTGLVIDRTFGY